MDGCHELSVGAVTQPSEFCRQRRRRIPGSKFIYAAPWESGIMLTRVRRGLLLGLHQLTVALGILLLPVALAVRRAGLRLPVPVASAVRATTRACERATE